MNDMRAKVSPGLALFLTMVGARDIWESSDAGYKAEWDGYANQFLALLVDQDPVGYITDLDLRMIQGRSVLVPTVNVWSEQDEGDHAIYLHPPPGNEVVAKMCSVHRCQEKATDEYEGSKSVRGEIRSVWYPRCIKHPLPGAATVRPLTYLEGGK